MELIRYSDIVLSCFVPGQSLSEHRMASHALVYVRSGEMTAKDNGTSIRIPAGGRPYSAVSIRLERKFLRDSFRTLNPKNFPRSAKRFEEAVIPLQSEPAVFSDAF